MSITNKPVDSYFFSIKISRYPNCLDTNTPLPFGYPNKFNAKYLDTEAPQSPDFDSYYLKSDTETPLPL